MLNDPFPPATAIADILLTLAAFAAAATVSARRGRRPIPHRPVVILLGALALTGAGHALAPALGGRAVAAFAAAALAWVATVLLGRCPPPGAAERAEPTADGAAAQLLEAALAACDDGVVIATTGDHAGVHIVYANPAFERLTGYSSDEAVGLSPSILADGADGLAAIREAVRGTAPVRVELPGRRKDGSRVWAEWQVVPVSDAGGRHTHSVAVLRDVTGRRRAERALREREELLRGVIAHIPCGVFWKDRDSVYLGCNERVARDHGLAGPERVLGRTDYDVMRDPAEATFYRECDRLVMESGLPVLDLEEHQTRPDGTRATLLTSKVPLRDAAGRVVGVLGVYQDITDRKRLEEHLRHGQKMEAVGRLAGGIAHDFNNLLTVIRGNAELLRSPAEDAGTAALFDDLALAADRATALVRQLLLFGRCQPARAEVLDLNEVVAALAGLLRRVLGERVAVEAVLAPRR